MKTSPALVAATVAFAVNAAAFWRMPCRSQTGVGRVDPIMYPGEISQHVHSITGGGNFGFNTSYTDLTADGTCTACEVAQDHSAYWVPTMNFMYPNGTVVMVPQIGGMLIYYLYYLSDVTAFPEGFEMAAGNPSIRNFTGPFPDTPLSFWPTDPTDQFFLQQRAIGFNCLNYAVAPEPSLYRHVLPTKEYMDAQCTDGLRLELAFPSCGNGSLDSSDHKSHMAYPSLVKEGNCPPGYNVHHPFLFYEVIWATNEFASEAGMFLLSYGDPLGTGYHGDYMMGWESQGFLQDALNTCQNLSGEIQDCALFDILEDTECAKCTFDMPEMLKNDHPQGPRNGLAVDVPIQYGPGEATTFPIPGQSGNPTTATPSPSTPSTFSDLSTLSYSPANPTSTSSAQGGIVVAMYSSETPVEPSTAISQATSASTPTSIVTSAPLLISTSTQPDFAATSLMTDCNQVVQLLIDEIDITVTATETQPVGSENRRHLHRHLHHAGH